MASPMRLAVVTGIFLAGAAIAYLTVTLGVEVPGAKGPSSEEAAGGGSRTRFVGPGADGFDAGDFDRMDSPDDEDDYLDPMDAIGAGGDGGVGGEGRGRRRGDADDEEMAALRAEAAARRAAAGGLPDPGGKHLEALEDVLATGDLEKIRMFLVSTMSQRGSEMGEAEAVALLRALGEIDHPGIQSAMLMHLERIGGDGVTEGLVAFLREGPKANVAARTLEALGRIDSPSAISALIQAMNSPDLGRARRTAADVLGRSRHPATVSLLAASLGEADRATRQMAAAALARVGTAGSYDAILAYARTGDPADRALGRRLLERSTRGPAAVTVMGPALSRESDIPLRVSLARALGQTRQENATAYLLRAATTDSAAQVRVEAVNSIARLGDRAAYADVERIATDDPSPAVQRAARKAMNRLGAR